VERRNLHLARRIAYKLPHTVPHLARRLVRERHGKYVLRRYALLEHVGDAERHCARLPRARAGENEHGAVDRGDCLPLLGIEIRQ